MRIFLGKPRNRMGIAIERWEKIGPKNHYAMRLPADCHLEIVRLWGVSIGGWFVGVQRLK